MVIIAFLQRKLTSYHWNGFHYQGEDTSMQMQLGPV
jgi:hypothetical protein